MGSQLRRRQLKPLDSLGHDGGELGPGGTSPSPKGKTGKGQVNTGSTFDAKSYISQLSSTYLPNSDDPMCKQQLRKYLLTVLLLSVIVVVILMLYRDTTTVLSYDTLFVIHFSNLYLQFA